MPSTCWRRPIATDPMSHSQCFASSIEHVMAWLWSGQAAAYVFGEAFPTQSSLKDYVYHYTARDGRLVLLYAVAITELMEIVAVHRSELVTLKAGVLHWLLRSRRVCLRVRLWHRLRSGLELGLPDHIINCYLRRDLPTILETFCLI